MSHPLLPFLQVILWLTCLLILLLLLLQFLHLLLLDDSDIRRMLETVMTIQAAYGQVLVDMLDELHALRMDLEHIRQLPPPPPFDDGF